MKKIIYYSILILFFVYSCKKETVKSTTVPKIVKKEKIIQKKETNKQIYLDSLFNSINLSNLKYDLHPYNFYPIFTYDLSPNIYYNITVISKDKNIKSKWSFNEFTRDENLVKKSKKYILDKIDKYYLVLLLIDNNIIKQDGNFFPSENFNYRIFIKKEKKWNLKKKEKFTDDYFIFMDSKFEEETKKYLP